MPTVPVPFRQFHFQIEVDGKDIGGFQEASGLRMEMETVKYREGGVNDYVHQLPGQFSHRNLVLRKGLTDKTVLLDWMQDIKTGKLNDGDYRRHLRVKLRSGYKTDKMWGWEFMNAYPVRWDGPDLSSDRSQGTVALQILEFAHEGFTKMEGTP